MCLIGTQDEIDKAEETIIEFQRSMLLEVDRTHICFLLPTILKAYLKRIEDVIYREEPSVVIDILSPLNLCK